jgi:hypothetical protein
LDFNFISSTFEEKISNLEEIVVVKEVLIAANFKCSLENTFRFEQENNVDALGKVALQRSIRNY